MEVEILKDGKYAKFTPDHISRQTLKAGTLIEYPDWYAQSLIDMGRAKKPGKDEDSAQAESGQEPAETTNQVTLAEATVEESPREKAQAVQQLEEKQQEAAFRRKRR